jgi:hypothetical protein
MTMTCVVALVRPTSSRPSKVAGFRPEVDQTVVSVGP